MGSRDHGRLARRAATALAAVAVLGWPARPIAHDIPADVTVVAFVRPEGQRLRLLVRAPLKAARDVDYPTRGPGYLDLARADRALADAATMWIAESLALYEDDTPLGPPRVAAVRVSLPSDLSFRSYEAALAHVTGARLSDDTDLYWSQGMLDILLEYSVESDRSRFSVRPELARLGLRVTTVLRFVPPGGASCAFALVGNPGLVRLDPRWHQAALRFVELGFLHILGGADHLLFLACLVIPLRRTRPLVLVVTAFTVAHSVTLVASAFALVPAGLWFPPLIETLIAASIVFMALENIVGAGLGRRWAIAFGFGLVHGYGFSFALRDTLQLAGSHLLTSLLSFNAGVEIGQLLVLALLVPALGLMFRFVVAERIGIILVSALVGHTAWHWMIDRGDLLRQYQFPWPVVDGALLADALSWSLALAGLAGLIWLTRARGVSWRARRATPEGP